MASARTKIRVFRQDGTPVAEYLLGEGVHSMGRDPASAIYLESDYVSGEHARLHLSATGIEIEDLNSTSGTYLDGVSVRGKLDIQPGQKIQIGDLQVDLTVEGAGEVTAEATLGAGRYTLVQELMLNHRQPKRPHPRPRKISPQPVHCSHGFRWLVSLSFWSVD